MERKDTSNDLNSFPKIQAEIKNLISETKILLEGNTDSDPKANSLSENFNHAQEILLKLSNLNTTVSSKQNLSHEVYCQFINFYLKIDHFDAVIQLYQKHFLSYPDDTVTFSLVEKLLAQENSFYESKLMTTEEKHQLILLLLADNKELNAEKFRAQSLYQLKDHKTGIMTNKSFNEIAGIDKNANVITFKKLRGILSEIEPSYEKTQLLQKIKEQKVYLYEHIVLNPKQLTPIPTKNRPHENEIDMDWIEESAAKAKELTIDILDNLLDQEKVEIQGENKQVSDNVRVLKKERRDLKKAEMKLQQEIDTMKEEKSKEEKQKDSLIAKNHQLLISIKALEIESEKQSAENSKLLDEYSALMLEPEKIIEENKKVLVELNQKKLETIENVKSLEEENQQLEQEITAKKENNANLKKQIDTQKNENEKLQKEMEEITEKNRLMKHNMVQTTKDIAEIERGFPTLTKQYNSLDRQYKELETQIRKLRADYGEKLTERNKLNGEHAQLTSEIEAKKKEVEELKAEAEPITEKEEVEEVKVDLEAENKTRIEKALMQNFFMHLEKMPSYQHLVAPERIQAIKSRINPNSTFQCQTKNQEKADVLEALKKMVEAKTATLNDFDKFMTDNEGKIIQTTRREQGMSGFFHKGEVTSKKWFLEIKKEWAAQKESIKIITGKDKGIEAKLPLDNDLI